MTTAILCPQLTVKSWLNNGLPNAFGTVASFQAGSTTPVATYTDYTAGTPNANPLTLNARGEANIYLLPNVGYKIAEADSAGNPIKTTDQVVQNQLITLYGGVDTGIVNAYVLNFAASFSSLTDGIVIYWTPAHTNTGPSTLNVNGLGVIAILNMDGSPLIATEIIGSFTQVIYKGGNWYLVPIGIQAPSGTIASPTWGGFSVVPTSIVNWTRNGNLITMTINAGTGTSNATGFTLALPAAINTLRSQVIPVAALIDNATNLTTVGCVQAYNGLMTFFPNGSVASVWTASSTKGFALPPSITYSLT
jgi:hypothetical protein